MEGLGRDPYFDLRHIPSLRCMGSLGNSNPRSLGYRHVAGPAGKEGLLVGPAGGPGGIVMKSSALPGSMGVYWLPLGSLGIWSMGRVPIRRKAERVGVLYICIYICTCIY